MPSALMAEGIGDFVLVIVVAKAGADPAGSLTVGGGDGVCVKRKLEQIPLNRPLVR